jgi:hypothetical protein
VRSNGAALAAKVEARHEENLRRFDNIDAQQAIMDDKLDNLLASRSFTRGVLKTVLLGSSAISAIVALIVTWIRS